MRRPHVPVGHQAVCCTFAVMLLAPAAARADNTTKDNARFLMVSHAVTETLSEGRRVLWYKTWLEADRSYQIWIWDPLNDPSIAPAQPSIRVGVDAGASPPVTADTSGITPFVNGISVLPQGGGVHYFEIFDRQAVPLAAAYSIRVLVLETTLFAPWYYVSPSQQYDSYLQLSNTTSSDLRVWVKAYDAAGVLVGGHGPGTPVMLPANGTALVRVGADLGVASGWGALSILYAAPPGGVTANLSVLSGLTGLSFDVPCRARVVWSSIGP